MNGAVTCIAMNLGGKRTGIVQLPVICNPNPDEILFCPPNTSVHHRPSFVLIMVETEIAKFSEGKQKRAQGAKSK